MKRTAALVLFVLAVGSVWNGFFIESAWAQGDRAAYEKWMNSVVVVLTSDGGQGSGFFINSNGLIVTNYHVVSQKQSVKVVLRNGRSYTGKVMAFNALYDLALVSIPQASPQYLQFAAKADLYQGAEVVAVGAPQGLGWSVSRGIISGFRKINGLVEMVQTDTAINPGNSGGPLILSKTGKVAAVNTSKIVEAEGMNFGVLGLEVAACFGGRTEQYEQMHPKWSAHQQGMNKALAQLEANPRQTLQTVTNLVKNTFPSADAYMLIAVAHIRLEEFDQQAKALAEALALNPSDTYVIALMAASLRSINKAKEADELLTFAVSFDPYQGRLWVARAKARRELKNYPKALEDAAYALKLNPNDDEAYFERARIRHAQGDRSGALADARKAQSIRSDPQYQKWIDSMPAGGAGTNNAPAAGIPVFPRIETPPPPTSPPPDGQQGPPEYYRAWDAFKQGDYHLALDYFSKASAKAPQFMPIHSGRAWVLQRTGDVNQSMNDLNWILNIDPNNTDAFFVRAHGWLILKSRTWTGLWPLKRSLGFTHFGR
jgi:tetratricopeptide (TPR) repeat protein